MRSCSASWHMDVPVCTAVKFGLCYPKWSCTCAGTVAALYRALAAAAGLPHEERPEERLLIVEAAMHRVARRLVFPRQLKNYTTM